MKGAKPVIAIDGPAGVGKSSVGKAVALRYDLSFLSTGEMYRCLGWKVLDMGINLDDEDKVFEAAKNIKWSFERASDNSLKVFVDGVYLGGKLFSDKVGQAASKASASARARAVVTQKQIEIGRAGAIVMEGRDIGTVICPGAQVKIFLTATAEERAKRRFLQLKQNGKTADYEQLLSSIKARDERDSSRAVAPLKPASDAVIIDTSDMTLRQVTDKVLEISSPYAS
ncbi:MAG: (d)CMP kinase [Elusimicrobiota bacterium]|jgi:cytidylate kinase|nr:(d)CMP kinase [Elusimicrobiota bacterium]